MLCLEKGTTIAWHWPLTAVLVPSQSVATDSQGYSFSCFHGAWVCFATEIRSFAYFVRKIKFTTSLPRITTYPGFPVSDKFIRTKTCVNKFLEMQPFPSFPNFILYRHMLFHYRSGQSIHIIQDPSVYFPPSSISCYGTFDVNPSPHCSNTHVSKPAWTFLL